MENGEVFTPLSEITAQRKGGVAQQKQTAPTPKTVRPQQGQANEDSARKAGQVHFKASHGLIVAFFTFILYVPTIIGWIMPRSAIVAKRVIGYFMALVYTCSQAVSSLHA